MVLRIKGSPTRRALVGVCVAAFFLVCISLQTHIFWSADEVGAKEQEERWIVAKRPPKFSLVIKLLTYDRLHSLIRCLDSLAAADYGTQVVKLHVFIDHFPLSDTLQSSSSKSSSSTGPAIEKKLQESHALLDYVDKFLWIHGPKEIHYRTQNAGLQGQWLEAWWPASDHEFSFMVEDDMYLSPLFFQYLRQVIENYYFNSSNYDPTIYGVSLQRPRFVPGKHGDQLRLDSATHIFLYQLVGTWGQLLFPKPWREFRVWYDAHKSRGLKPVLDGMVTTGWYHRSGERIWTPWFIKFTYSKGYFNLYTHFSNEQALSVSYRDKGVNTKKEAGPDSTLIKDGSMSGLDLFEMKPLKELKRYDFCFHEVKQHRLIKNIQDVSTHLTSIQENGTIILVNALGFWEGVVRNWVCHFSKFSIRNYAILVQDRGLGDDLLRRGHAVIHLDPGVLERESEDNIPHKKKALTIVQAVMMLLQAGYNIWLTDVGTFWLANPLPLVQIDNADMLGFAVGMQVSSELFYIKGSNRTKALWSTLYKDVLHQAESPIHYKEDYVGALVGHLTSKDMLSFNILSPTLKSNFSILANSNHSDNSLKLEAALLMGSPNNNSYVSFMKSVGLWKLDDELVCTGVYC